MPANGVQGRVELLGHVFLDDSLGGGLHGDPQQIEQQHFQFGVPSLDRDGRGWRLIQGERGHAAKLPYSTNNARSEELAAKPTYRTPWTKGQRCIIPASSFDEPYWGTGKNVWWRFRRADGMPWGLAGLWNTWADRATGEVHESYTMLTINADDHALMRLMHKPDPKLAADQQDKRSVIPIEAGDVDQSLAGTIEEAMSLLRLPGPETFEHGPVDPASKVTISA